ncbi:MAG TPA: hypothetical protein PLY09_06330 [Methanothrix sp.]|nr:hypothetical protein [Methanothrix sp.]HPJ84359.1 hypothetical protein [Methanothrix sp.]
MNYRLINEDVVYAEIYKTKLEGLHKELKSANELEYRDIRINEFYEYNRFVIFPDHTIAMCSKARFSSDEFIRIFKVLFNLNCPNYAVNVDINYRRDDYDIFDIINSFDKMVAVTIKKLRKSNPNPRPTFEKIEKFLEKEQTDEYSAQFISDQNSKYGLTRDHDSHIMSAISLSDEGYGQSIIKGIRGVEQVVINTKDKIIQANVNKADKDKIQDFVGTITKKFSKYIRFDH